MLEVRDTLKKSLFYLVTFLICIVLLESFLTLSGKAILFFADDSDTTYKKRISSDEIIIVTLGESTTAGYFSGGKDRSWPQRLEDELAQDFKNVKVINEAISGTNTLFLASKYEMISEKYKPDILISMVGINDDRLKYNVFDQNKLMGFIYDRKIVKIITFVIDHLFSSKRSTHEQVYSQKINDHVRIIVDNILAFDSIKKITLELNKNSKILDELIYYYLYRSNFLEKFTQADKELFYQNFKEHFLKNPQNYYLAEFLAMFDYDQKQYEDCVTVLELLYKHIEKENNNLLAHYSLCYSYLEDKHKSFKSLNSTYFSNNLSSLENTKKNILYIKNRAEEDGTKVYFMQYPLLDACKISYFLSSDEKNITSENYTQYLLRDPNFNCISNENYSLIENKNNFEVELRQRQYEELFVDRFTPIFGHASDYGNDLIAENVYQVILPKVKEISKKR